MLPLADVFSPDLCALLAPLPGPEPTGESLRYSPVYAQIRDARLEEDQSLPMGEWTRALKKADWPAMETLCIDVLTTSTKDLQIAGWLTEAWTRRHGLAGLAAGAQLLEGLCRNFWDDIHPRIEDDDVEIRVAPLFWINDNIAQTLFLHLPLMPACSTISSSAWSGRSPPPARQLHPRSKGRCRGRQGVCPARSATLRRKPPPAVPSAWCAKATRS